MTKWLRAEQNLESLLIIPNIIYFIESDNFEFTMREAQSRNSFQNKVAYAHSVEGLNVINGPKCNKVLYYINCSVLQRFLPPRNVVSEHT